MHLKLGLLKNNLNSCFAFLAAFAIAATAATSVAAQEIKKSGSGICHCLGGQYYDRTTNFTAFDTIAACLASGGREPQRGQGTCPVDSANEPTAMPVPRRYARSVFGGWADEDADCQNTRHERLIARSLDPVELAGNGCLVITGRWIDLYTGETYTAASELEIDHVVPLFYAWERGAAFWEPEKQRRFANDPANLLPVGVTANRSKGAAGPLDWLPPAEEFHCEYLLQFSRVIQRYDLSLPVDEEERLQLLTAEKVQLNSRRRLTHKILHRTGQGGLTHTNESPEIRGLFIPVESGQPQAAMALFMRSMIRSLRAVSCFRCDPVTSSVATNRLSCAPGIAMEYRCRIASCGRPP